VIEIGLNRGSRPEANDHVTRQPDRGPGREHERLAGEELLQDVVLERSGEVCLGHALPFGGDEVHRQDDRGGRVDREVDRDAIKGQSREQIDHVVGGVDRDPDSSDLRPGQRVAGVVPQLCRQVERDGQRRLPTFEQEVEPFVRLLRRPEPGELAHRPEPAAIHRGVRAAGEGRVSGGA
jgi:hypothetical protein